MKQPSAANFTAQTLPESPPAFPWWVAALASVVQRVKLRR